METMLKSKNGVTLIKYTELKYFKNGRANMHMERGYHVECGKRSKYWIKSKAEATKEFARLVKEKLMPTASITTRESTHE